MICLILEENNKWKGGFWKILSTAPTLFCRNFAAEFESNTKMLQSDKQKAAHKLAAEYLEFLDEQEALVDRLIGRRWKQIEPWLEQIIDKKIQEHLGS